MSRIEWMEVVDSTNSELRRRMDELDNLSVVAALSQTAGRGQGDHKWHSDAGINLTFSLALKFSADFALPSRLQVSITHMMTLSLLDYLKDHGVQARIKWPNDIWVADRKICGILIENMLSGEDMRASIIGVGLNLNEVDFPTDLPNPVSLAQLTGKQYDIKSELESLYKKICRRAPMMSSADGRDSLQEEFGKNVFRLDA